MMANLIGLIFVVAWASFPFWGTAVYEHGAAIRRSLGNLIPCAIPLAFGLMLVATGNGFTGANLACLGVFVLYFALGCILCSRYGSELGDG